MVSLSVWKWRYFHLHEYSLSVTLVIQFFQAISVWDLSLLVILKMVYFQFPFLIINFYELGVNERIIWVVDTLNIGFIYKFPWYNLLLKT